MHNKRRNREVNSLLKYIMGHKKIDMLAYSNTTYVYFDD
jgi:hypothetical protein